MCLLSGAADGKQDERYTIGPARTDEASGGLGAGPISVGAVSGWKLRRYRSRPREPAADCGPHRRKRVAPGCPHCSIPSATM